MGLDCICSIQTGCVQSLEFLKVLKFTPSFSRPGKSLENGDKVWKHGKKSWFFFQSYRKWVISRIFFVLVKSYSISSVRLQHIMKKALFLCFFKGLYWPPELITLSMEIESIVLEKSLEKVLNFGSQNLYKPSTNKLVPLAVATYKNCKGCVYFTYTLWMQFCYGPLSLAPLP